MPKRSLIFLAVFASLAAAAEEDAVAQKTEPLPSKVAGPTWDLAAEGQFAMALQRLGAQVDLKLRAKRALGGPSAAARK